MNSFWWGREQNELLVKNFIGRTWQPNPFHLSKQLSLGKNEKRKEKVNLARKSCLGKK